jgi:hypothetical protein
MLTITYTHELEIKLKEAVAPQQKTLEKNIAENAKKEPESLLFAR